ncbi:MAG: DUF7151 family protein [Bacteroidales bacterium]
MKIIIRFFVAILMIVSVLLPMKAGAQAPNKMSYQAVIRNTSNTLVTNQAIGMRISILQGSTSGTSVYVEIQTPITNTNGLASIEIGGGTIVSGSFSSINWANGPYFIKTETDPNGGTNYSVTGISQLLSVPYALYAENSGNSIPGPQGPQGTVGPQGPTGNNGANGQQGNAGINGTNGKNTLAKTTTEAAGVNCATGGFKIEYGLDTNYNGVLDAGEINAVFTKYVCNGATGPQGPVGATGPQGISITNSFVQGDSLYVNLSNGQTLNTGKVSGPQGTTGTQGPQGAQGMTGITGPQGIQGNNGTQGYDLISVGDMIVIYTSTNAYGFSQNQNSSSLSQGFPDDNAGQWTSVALNDTVIGVESSEKQIVIYTNTHAYGFSKEQYSGSTQIYPDDNAGQWISIALSGTPIASFHSQKQVVIVTTTNAYGFSQNQNSSSLSQGFPDDNAGQWVFTAITGTLLGGKASNKNIVIYTTTNAYGFSQDQSSGSTQIYPDDNLGQWTILNLSGTAKGIINTK